MDWRLVVDGIPESLRALAVPVASLRPYPGNARSGNVDVIVESLERNGQYRPVVVNSRTSEVLAGNHTLQAAKVLGWSELAATFVDADEEQARRIVLVDNRSNDLAGYDDAALIELLRSLDDLAGTGFSVEELDAMLATTALPASLTDPDDTPAAPRFARTEVGDVWQLGPHRVVCGDSSDVMVLDALMQDVRPGALLADPPYGMHLVADWSSAKGSLKSLGGGKTAGNRYDNVIGDHEDFDPAPYQTMFDDVAEQFWFGADYYAERLLGKNDGSWLVWDKRKESQADAIGAEFELCWSRKKHKRRMLRHDWFGFLASGSNAADARRRVHPTQKPVTLMVDILQQWTPPGAVVLDPFGGSGTTLIACHASGRVARLGELDPRYVDVICRRYQEHTGTLPVLESTGEEHDFTDGDH